MIYYNKQQSGFSLVETLVAVSLLLIVIVGPMSITSRTAKSSSFATEQIQAFFLAQEGVELAQKARDDLMLKFFEDPIINDNPWGQFMSTTGGAYQLCRTNGCGLEWGSTPGQLAAPVECAGGTCRLYVRNTNARSMFTHSSVGGNTVTPFTRVIRFEAPPSELNPAREVKIISTVTWRTGSLVQSQTVEVDTYLYNTYDTD